MRSMGAVVVLSAVLLLSGEARAGEKPRVGDPAPPFSLAAATRDSILSSKVSLSDYAGKRAVIIAFYPADWSSGCTKEMCTMRDNFADLGTLGAEVLGISGDYVYSHREWAKALGLPFLLLSDHNHAVARAYESFPEGRELNLRTVYVVDMQGRIAYIDQAYRAGAPESFENLRKALGTVLIHPGEKHFSALRQLTFGGENAEGYFSFDEKRLIFQSTRDGHACDQEYIMDLATGATRLVSTGKGRTTCGYFFPGDSTILFSSTHHLKTECPPPPDFSHGYTWAVYPEYDIFTARADGSNLRQLTTTPGYDAESTISPKGDRIVFTSVRNGDLDLYSMNLDGSDVKQLTHELGYDGGAFFSWDGSMIVYRGWHQTDSADIAAYRSLLAQNIVRPTRMELFVMNADGSNKRQITNNGAANFGPFFHPDNKRIIFASNVADPKGRDFDLYLINVDGTGLERITYNETFDGFPMFTHDGKHLVFASNRAGKVRGETNLFIADWTN